VTGGRLYTRCGSTCRAARSSIPQPPPVPCRIFPNEKQAQNKHQIDVSHYQKKAQPKSPPLHRSRASTRTVGRSVGQPGRGSPKRCQRSLAHPLRCPFARRFVRPSVHSSVGSCIRRAAYQNVDLTSHPSPVRSSVWRGPTLSERTHVAGETHGEINVAAESQRCRGHAAGATLPERANVVGKDPRCR